MSAPTKFYRGKPWSPTIRPCEVCGASLQTTVGEARRAAALQCPNGHPLTFDADAFDASIRTSEPWVVNCTWNCSRIFEGGVCSA